MGNIENRKKIVTVFGSSSPKSGDSEYQTAFQLGRMLSEAKYILCNGGYGGTMEASAKGASDTGGKTIGIITDFFNHSANPYMDEVIKVKSLIDRLLKLIELGDAYVVLKGSTGTLVELAMVWEYMNKRILKQKPIIVVGDFWRPVVATLQSELMYEKLDDVTKFVTTVQTPHECVDLLNKKLKCNI